MPNEVVLKRPPQGSLRHGHPWIYKNQIKEVSASAEPGEVLRVVTESGKFLGLAYWNPKSEISLRLLTRKEEPVDRDFFKTRLSRAVDFRRRTVSDTNAMRLVSSEADGLSGLIVDRYNETLVVQFLTLGMEKMKPMLLETLSEVVPNRGVFERSDSSVRKLEGLSERVGWIEKNCGDETVIP